MKNSMSQKEYLDQRKTPFDIIKSPIDVKSDHSIEINDSKMAPFNVIKSPINVRPDHSIEINDVRLNIPK